MTAPTPPSSTCEAALTPAHLSQRQAGLGSGGSQRFAQVSQAVRIVRIGVLPRHTLRSRPVSPKPCCRAAAAYSGPYLRAERGGGPRHHHYIPHGVCACGAGGPSVAKKVRCTFSITAEIGKKSILEVRWLLPDALPRSVRCV